MASGDKKEKKIPVRRLRRAGVDFIRIPMLGYDNILETFIKKVDLKKYNIRVFNAGDVPVDKIQKSGLNSYIVFGSHSEKGFFSKTYTDFLRNGINPGRYHRGTDNPGHKLQALAGVIFPDAASFAAALKDPDDIVRGAAEGLMNSVLKRENGYRHLLGKPGDAEKHAKRVLYVYDLDNPEQSFQELIALMGIEEPVELVPAPSYTDVALDADTEVQLKSRVKDDFESLAALKPAGK